MREDQRFAADEMIFGEIRHEFRLSRYISKRQITPLFRSVQDKNLSRGQCERTLSDCKMHRAEFFVQVDGASSKN